MKNIKLFCSLVLCYSGLLIGAAAEPQASELENMQQALHVLSCSPYLSTQDNKSLSLVNHGVHDAAELALVTAMEKAAIRESYIVNARLLDLAGQRYDYVDNQSFKDYVTQSIKDFVADNPGAWIKLDLSYNKFGKDLGFLRDLLNAIATTAAILRIEVTNIDLSNNKLTSLPEHLFEGFNNLIELDLEGNCLEHLPGHLFDGLKNLQDLNLSHNWLSDLHEHLFEGLVNLQALDLSYNLLMSLPEGLFKGLNNLQELSLNNNQLMSLPERLFESSNNLRALFVASNLLMDLPEHLFDGLNNLKRVCCRENRLSKESQRILQNLIKRGVDAY